MKENNLPRSLILKKRNDITRLLAQGIRFDGKCIRIITLKKTGQQYGKTAFLVNKRLARKANLRVKVKRWLRELFRNNKLLLPLHLDLGISVRVPYKNLTYRDLADDFHSVISSKEFIDLCSKSLSEIAVTPENG